MVPEDGEPAPRAKSRAPAPGAPGAAGTPGAPGAPSPPAAEDAFAPTIAPAARPSAAMTAPLRPAAVRSTLTPLESDATLAAPVSVTSAVPGAGTAPPLPIVPGEHYKPEKEIARGGMGRIVAALDQRLGRPVALKQLLDPAPDQIGRFQREALITARLQHPGIVPVYEAGRWPTGEPFFAMKLVAGRPLDKVIAETRTLEERLALLPRIAAAADAIAYAHSQRVIHRDLKPGNVLIGDFGETVVIDWGLAKDLDASDAPDSRERLPERPSRRTAMSSTTDGATLTVAGAVMGTPAYMAPEQARGEALDQRADVFALGAMLYHVLAGVPPYDARTATDVIAAAAVGRVVPLAEREKAAPPDLVAIVHRAMAHAPADRYPHAGELADELRRFMTGQLVDAHQYTAWQKLGRFVRKHRAAVTIAALSLGTFAVFGTLAVRQIIAQRDAATYERRIADTRRHAAEQLIDRMLSDVKDRLTQIGRLDVLANVGGEIRDYYRTLAQIPGGMPEEDEERMAGAVDLVAMAERESGRLDDALKTWSDARAQLARSIGADTSPATLHRRRMLARFDFQIGTVHQQRGKLAEAMQSFTAAKQAYDALREHAPSDRAVLLGAAETHDKLGDLLRNEGQLDAALDEYLEAKRERELAGGQASSRPTEEVLALSTSHLKLGTVYVLRGETASAFTAYRAALRLRETLRESQPDNVTVLEKVLEVQDLLAQLQRQTGDDRSAIQTYRQALAVGNGLVRRDPTNTTWKRQRGNLRANLGFALLDVGEYRSGLTELGHAIENQQELVARDPASQAWQGDLARFYTRAGDGHLYLGEHDRAMELYRLAHDIREKLVSSAPRSAPYRRSVAWSHAKLASAHELAGERGPAIEAHGRALALRTELVGEAPAHSGFKNELAATEVALGRLLAARDARRARTLIDAGLARARELVAGDPLNAEWKETLTQALLAQAELARTTGDHATRATALDEARVLATAAAERAPHNAHWPGYVAEIHAGLGDWTRVRDTLEPLAAAGRLPATRKPLLDRAR